ncbi:LysR family transcriptional regulator [Amycolatopsis granulosa]|uniref:LysR family transcriptional regulator n=1 Tax=Amycolatopsis granulosa TaxID=185684 RepID=UPI0014229EA6|nr:DNA-binding transcriptional LysR family regulator [Amycolatopsis granulosa]
MTLDDLRVFLDVCERGSFTAVAKTLSCSQSAVSQHVRRLERELGLPLLERLPRGVLPTPAGRLLRDAAAVGVGRIDAAAERLRAMARSGGVDEVRISTGSATVRAFMRDAITTLQTRYPDVKLTFRTQPTTRDCLADIEADRSDIALVSIVGPIAGVEIRPIVALQWTLTVHRDDPLAARDSITVDELATLPNLVLPVSSSSLSALHPMLGAANFRDAGVAEWDTAMLLAETGVNRALVATIPRYAPAELPHLRFVPIDDLKAPTAGWAARSWAELPKPILEFAETVEAEMRK